MAVDYGLRRLGIAVSDEGGSLARPLATIVVKDGRDPVGTLRDLVRAQAPGKVLVGNPRRLDGSPGTLSAVIAAFVGRLRETIGVPVQMWDEGLTTVAAQEKLREAGASRRKRKAMADSAAAAVILQDFLDASRGTGG
jgi:putative Holliday junction resolvase